MGLKGSELAYLRREKGLPYVKLSVRKRVYLEDDLMEWFRANRMKADMTQKVEEEEESEKGEFQEVESEEFPDTD